MKMNKFFGGAMSGKLLKSLTDNPEIAGGLASGNLLKAAKGHNAAIMGAIANHFLGGLGLGGGDEEDEMVEMEGPVKEEMEEDEGERLPKEARKRLAILVLGKKMK